MWAGHVIVNPSAAADLRCVAILSRVCFCEWPESISPSLMILASSVYCVGAMHSHL